MNQAIYYIHQADFDNDKLNQYIINTVRNDTNNTDADNTDIDNGTGADNSNLDRSNLDSSDLYSIDLNNSNNAQPIVIPIQHLFNKNLLLSALAEACDFPSYCHNNWDSAFDCLTDSNVSNLVLDLTQVTDINKNDLQAFIELIEDAYSDFGKPRLWIVTTKKD